MIRLVDGMLITLDMKSGQNMYDNINFYQSLQIGGLDDMCFKEEKFHTNMSTPICI